MSKRIDTTRARKEALPVILEAARNYLTDHGGVHTPSPSRIREALEAFK